MRTVSGPRNRLILVVASVIALLAAAWLASAALGLTTRWPGAEVVLPHGGSTPASLATAHDQWMPPVAVVATVLAVVIGIWLLVLQVPSRPTTAPLRFSDDRSALLGTLEPAVLERALSEHIEDVSGVLEASVQVSGTTTAVWVQASATIAEDAEACWAAQSVRGRLAEDIRTVLGVEARQIDLLIRLRSSAAPSRSLVGTPERVPADRQGTSAQQSTSTQQEASADPGTAPA